MRVASGRALAAVAALLALSSTGVEGVANCNECAAGKTCLLEDKSLSIGGGQATLPLKFCNFDAAKKSAYALTFSLQKPLECDPDNSLMPQVTSLAPTAGCTPTNCVVTATLKEAVDWAVLLKNGDAPSVLQAKLDGGGGDGSVVQVAQGTADTGASAITGTTGSTATVCTTSFGLKASRLSKRAECNKVTVCRGKAADTGCTTPVPSVSNARVGDVNCTAETCTGTMTFGGGLPCDAASGDGNAVLVSIQVGNSAGSSYGSIATVSAATAATISTATGAAVGSTQVTIQSDATCSKNSLNVTVDGLALKDFTPANGSIVVSLAAALTSTQAGSNLDITVSQCGVASKEFTTKVGETGSEASVPTKAQNKTSNSSSKGSDVGSGTLTGSQTTQKQNASTGLPYGLYIAIGVGALAVVGFLFECVYHRQRHRKEHGEGGNAVNAV